ncbi:MAG: cation diffusion facilitator family transporter [Alphaproteobacteria bacterium]|nr:cation diffusion facilitator family transporter [Alphaproteobacteria bacterium]
MTATPQPSLKRRIRTVAAASIAVALVVMAIKYIAYLATGSVALYSDALESIVNVAAGIAAWAAIRVANKPADREHPYGHHKAELLSAVFEGALIIVAALFIVLEASHAILHPRTIEQPVIGLMINGIATAINAGWSMFLIRKGTDWRSPALTADGWHLMTDVWTSVGVFVGIVLVVLTGWTILDPILALLVAANILFMGYRIVSQSVSALMDEAPPEDVQQRIHQAIVRSGDGAIEAHDIRTRHAGRATFIEFHLVVPGDMTVAAAHDICDRLEAELEAEIEGSDVIIHIEPEEKAKNQAKGVIGFE